MGGNRGDIVAVIGDGGRVVYAETEGRFLPSVVTKLYFLASAVFRSCFNRRISSSASLTF